MNWAAEKLRELASKCEVESFMEGDPSRFLRVQEGDANREAVAFVASALSFGSRPQFLKRIEWLVERSNGSMDAWIRSGAFERDLPDDPSTPFYRFFTQADMRSFLARYRAIMNEYGTLGEYVRSRASTGLEAVKAIVEAFAGASVHPVVPKCADSACQRVCMFLRWMARDSSPVDLGLWSAFLARASLIIPLDTHVLQEARRHGLMKGRNATMSAALRLTAKLSEIFPGDPLKGDFALFGAAVCGAT